MVKEYVCKVLVVEVFDDENFNIALTDKDQKIFNRTFHAPDKVKNAMLDISVASITTGKLVVARFEKLGPDGQPENLKSLGLLPRNQ